MLSQGPYLKVPSGTCELDQFDGIDINETDYFQSIINPTEDSGVFVIKNS